MRESVRKNLKITHDPNTRNIMGKYYGVVSNLLLCICECVYIHTDRYVHVIDNLVWKSLCSSMIVSFGEIPRGGISSQLISSYVFGE